MESDVCVAAAVIGLGMPVLRSGNGCMRQSGGRGGNLRFGRKTDHGTGILEDASAVGELLSMSFSSPRS